MLTRIRAWAARGAAVALTVASAGATLAAEAVGVRTLPVAVPGRAEPVAVTLWYPAGSGGVPERVGENAVFEGAPALRDATLAEGRFPLILLSHGGLRSAPDQSGWVASDLAARGAIVAAVHGPRPADARAAVAETWLRPADLSAALTAIGADPAVAAHQAPEAPAVVGFFLGGTAGLVLAGARLDPELYARSCDETVGGGPDCAWFADAGIDLHAVDAAPQSAGAADPRIGSVVAIAPELTSAFAPDSLPPIAARIAIVTLGNPMTVPAFLATSGLRAALPGATAVSLPDATMMSAMATCTPRGGVILAEEGEDDAICREDAATRNRIHAALADAIAAELGLQ